MKKINKNCIVPFELENYFNANRNKSWKNFKDECQVGYKELLQEIKKNQGGVCCYCEITFLDGRGIRDDFRVEHFYPKSDTDNSEINWNLIWTNLFGCCLGGSDKTVLQTTRFISNIKHRHSDILKGSEDWDNEILNPLNIPAFPPVFEVYSSGEMLVLEENCRTCGVDPIKAQNCLDEKKLNLNSPTLKGWRKEVVNNLRNEVSKIFDLTGDFENSVITVTSAHLEKDELGNYMPFFSTIRSYFKEDAENFLKTNNYNG